MFSRPIMAAASLLALAGCGGDGQRVAAADAPAARAEPPAAAVRVPPGGGTPSLYRAADLAPLAWDDAPTVPAVDHLVGTGGDDRLVYFVDRRGALQSLDLELGRVRPLAGGVAAAAAAPDGAVVVADTAGAVSRIRRRTPTPLRGSLAGGPGRLFPTQRGGVLAVAEDGTVSVLGPDHPPATVKLPAGAVTSTAWGELLAVGVDSGLVFYAPRERDSMRHTPTARPVHAVAFSPSGHRVYAALPDGELLVVDRFGSGVLARMRLPGAAGALRADRYGRWLLARPVVGDSLWVVDVLAERVAGTVAAPWSGDLPAVAGDRLLVRGGADVRVLDLRADGFPVRGSVEGGAGDRWQLVEWMPPSAAPDRSEPELAGGAAEGAVDGGAGAPDDESGESESGGRVYLQVSSSRNPDWAADLARQMRGAGLPASVLDPAADGEPYRVVLGPYRSREAADEAGRGLGRPYFVIAPGTSDADASAAGAEDP